MDLGLQETGQDTWRTEAIDGNARPVAPVVAMVKEMPVPEDVDGPATAETPPTAPMTAQDRLDRVLGSLADAAELPSAKVVTLRAILKNVRDSVDNAIKLLESLQPDGPAVAAAASTIVTVPQEPKIERFEGPDDRVVEGVFDGQNMVGDDGKSYAVPPNYASKSKLLEGDMLKLTIGPRGNFIYKQIGPIERQRLVGAVAYEQDSGHHIVLAGGRSWRVLKASVTYYKADVGDEAVVLVPKNAPSKWAAVENIIKKTPQASMM